MRAPPYGSLFPVPVHNELPLYHPLLRPSCSCRTPVQCLAVCLSKLEVVDTPGVVERNPMSPLCGVVGGEHETNEDLSVIFPIQPRSPGPHTVTPLAVAGGHQSPGAMDGAGLFLK